jgi:hypothetical protein
VNYLLSNPANDRGYYCIMLEDCCASYTPEFHEVSVRMISSQGGIFGSVADSDTLISQLNEGSVKETSTMTNGTAKGDSFEVVNTPNGATGDVPMPLSVPANSFINAKPYKWPYNGNMTPQNTCLIVIDMQVDFCAK